LPAPPAGPSPFDPSPLEAGRFSGAARCADTFHLPVGQLPPGGRIPVSGSQIALENRYLDFAPRKEQGKSQQGFKELPPAFSTQHAPPKEQNPPDPSSADLRVKMPLFAKQQPPRAALLSHTPSTRGCSPPARIPEPRRNTDVVGAPLRPRVSCTFYLGVLMVLSSFGFGPPQWRSRLDSVRSRALPPLSRLPHSPFFSGFLLEGCFRWQGFFSVTPGVFPSPPQGGQMNFLCFPPSGALPSPAQGRLRFKRILETVL